MLKTAVFKKLFGKALIFDSTKYPKDMHYWSVIKRGLFAKETFAIFKYVGKLINDSLIQFTEWFELTYWCLKRS